MRKRSMKRLTIFTLTFSLALVSLPAINSGQGELRQRVRDASILRSVPNPLILRYKSGTVAVQRQTVRNRAFAQQMMKLADETGESVAAELIQIPDFMTVEETESYLKTEPSVA